MLSRIFLNQQSCRCNIQPTPLLFLGGDSYLNHVVFHNIQPTIEEVVMLMQYSVDPTLLLESGKSKEVTFPKKSSVNTTLLFGGDAYFNHVLNIYSHVPYEQGSIPLSLSTLPPSPRMILFYWNDLVEPQSSSLQISYASIFSSVWKVLGSPKLVFDTFELLTFETTPTWDPWPLP
jgi:hypothetical protein